MEIFQLIAPYVLCFFGVVLFLIISLKVVLFVREKKLSNQPQKKYFSENELKGENNER